MMPRSAAGLLGAVLILAVLWDAFEVMILPRRVERRLRLARGFYRSTWRMWSAVGRSMSPGRRREAYLGVYGPLSLLVLFVLWATALIGGFGLVQWALRFQPALDRGPATLADALYLSGSTFFTLGLGDIVPIGAAAKTLAVVEAGTGFLFLAVIVGYLPVMYQAFSRREVAISMLDARAGSVWAMVRPRIGGSPSCGVSTSPTSTAWRRVFYSPSRAGSSRSAAPTT